MVFGKYMLAFILALAAGAAAFSQTPEIPWTEELEGSYVKADNRAVERLLKGMDGHRDTNDPALGEWSCTAHSVAELDLMNPYLPAMASETVSTLTHDPGGDCETVSASRISGMELGNGVLGQFLGAMYLRSDYYRAFTSFFGVDFPSPARSGSLLYYDYFITDSLAVDGRKTYRVKYHPVKGFRGAALEGEMLVDAGEYALRAVHARMSGGSNVNWLRELSVDSEYRRGEGGWYMVEEVLSADFSAALSDSTDVRSFLGRRRLAFGAPDYHPSGAGLHGVSVAEDVGSHEAAWWEENRPGPLLPREEDAFRITALVKELPTMKTAYTLAQTIVSGYADAGPVEFGPVFRTVSFNNLEGFRPQFGLRTTESLSARRRAGAYVAYGFRDRAVKGGVSYERMFSSSPVRKLTLSASHDSYQLGRGTSPATGMNIFSSLLSKPDAQRLCMLTDCSLLYEHEAAPGAGLYAGAAFRRYHAGAYVPMFSTSGVPIPYVTSAELSLKARFSWKETMGRGTFGKRYLGTRYPVVILGVTAGLPGIAEDCVPFVRPELDLDWRLHLPPAGISHIHANAGAVFGTVPYPLLHFPEGNGTYIHDPAAFSCMEFFEYASDRWATVFWNHSFGGLLFGLIPGVRELDLREEISARAAFGSLSKKNDPACGAAPMAFPEGMRAMDGPYVELGAGVSNILHLFRVDCFWRLTDREYELGGTVVEARRPFVVNLGLDLRF